MPDDDNSSNDGSLNRFGTFRRSLKQINPFRKNFFRLPATPRLSRSTKTLGKGEEATSWNFERPSSVTNHNNNNNNNNDKQEFKFPPLPKTDSTLNKKVSKQSLNSKNDGIYFSVHSPSSSSCYDTNTGDNDNSSIIYNYPPKVDRYLRVDKHNINQNRQSFPTINPPSATEAENFIQDQIKNLITPDLPYGHHHYKFLPNTSYAPTGEIFDAQWQQRENFIQNESATSSLSNSMVSLVNRISIRSKSVNNSIRRQTNSLKPLYPLNGIFHHQSTKSLQESKSPLQHKINPLFSIVDFISQNEAEKPFLGREWVFKDMHQMIINEKTQFTLIYGNPGSGKSTIIRQIILQSSFFKNSNSNGDTVDSGITIGSQSSLTSTLSSKNYEWFKAISSKVIAYHNCRLYSAITCMLPEFIRNITSNLYSSPLLENFSEIINENSELLELLHSSNAAITVEPVELFKRLIINPLNRLKITNDECYIIVIDGLDDADFHRNENGESISWLLKQIHHELPEWLRFVITSSCYSLLCNLSVRTINIDDSEMDQRVKRDGRLIVDYRITTNQKLEQKFKEYNELNSMTDIVDELVTISQGNHLYLHLILDLLENDKINLETCNLTLLPNNLSQLYLLLLNIHFKTITQFNQVSDIISVIIASLKPLNHEQLLNILNSAEKELIITSDELKQKLSMLSTVIIKLTNGCYVPIHSTFRDWILKISDQTDYNIDIRMGHILHALYLVRKGNLNTELIFELGHHLLKANPYKYLRKDMANDLPKGKDCQIEWIKLSVNNHNIIQNALLNERNLYYPNSKVSKLICLCDANTNACWPDDDTLLCKYSYIGNISMVQVLLHYNADPNLFNKSTGMTPLMMAIHKGYLDIVRLLIVNCARLDVMDKNKRTPIIHAAISPSTNSVNIMNFLIEYTTKHKLPLDNEFTLAFEAAASYGKISICELLLKIKNSILNLSTAMCAACANGQTETVQFLLARGATLSVDHYWQGKSALLYAIDSGSWDLVVNILNTSNIDLNNDYKTDEGWTSLIVACRHGHTGLVDLLINRGANMDIKDNKGQTAIMHAIIKENTSTINLLIDRGCNIYLKDNNGNGLIHLLAQYTNKFIIDKLLSLGLSLEDKNNSDLRAVEISIWNRNHHAVEIFLRRGARLRTLTWKIALESDPEFILVLIRKLLDDAAILLKRKHQKEAIQRFEYALDKCNELLIDNYMTDNNRDYNRSSVIINNFDRQKVICIKPQLIHYKVQILIAMSNIKRKNNELFAAISYATEGLNITDNNDSRFELFMCRAKSYFDDHNITNALIDAKAAAMIKPDNNDVSNLLSILNMP